ncbi:hypothetical protein [Paraliobacillus ryukyuensis]|uniref:hypothetical protein n=1 Tax=Paraliobacillus ryukyuensis TaxID=200904 RepID=UPI0009A72FFD|nr:hypothetical protein [Paraliobacillus ryukyuensis]
MNRIWSDENDKILRKYYPIKTSTEIIEFLPNFTNRQINRRAKYLGLRKKDEIRKKSRLEKSLAARKDLWTDDEKQIIIDYYGTEGAYGVQSRLEKYRSIDHITKIANRMGITKENKNSKFWTVTNIRTYEENSQIVLDVDIEGGGRKNND